MSLSWKLYRMVCVLQMSICTFMLLTMLLDFFRSPSLVGIFPLLLFLLIIFQSIFAVNLLNNNYPETPITGKQKKNFNRLFLLNFLFLTVLFSLIFADYRSTKNVAKILEKPFFQLPVLILLSFFTYIVILIFQLIILYGLYELRRQLYVNFMKKKFDFET